MGRKLFKTKFLHGSNAYWMKRSHPDHPCHKPHIGEVYCLYDKGEGWGYAVFNVLRITGGFFVRSLYHINKTVWAHTTIKRHLLEFGYVYRNGGIINYDDNGEVMLRDCQMNFRFDPCMDCEVKLSRHTIETIDFHTNRAFLERYKKDFPQLIVPCMEAMDQEISYVPLDYMPYAPEALRPVLKEIRAVFTRKPHFGRQISIKMKNMAILLVRKTLTAITDQVYPRLFDEQKAELAKFEKDPLDCFESRPNLEIAKKRLGLTGADLKKYFWQRHNLSFSEFVKQVWVEEVARRLKADYGESIESIALDLGWSSAGNLSNDFKRMTGLSPSEYRLKYKQLE